MAILFLFVTGRLFFWQFRLVVVLTPVYTLAGGNAVSVGKCALLFIKLWMSLKDRESLDTRFFWAAPPAVLMRSPRAPKHLPWWHISCVSSGRKRVGKLSGPMTACFGTMAANVDDLTTYRQ
jgi:hypothetical protein